MSLLTPLPDPPSISDPANFQSKADAFVAALQVMVVQINALGTPGLGGGTMTGALILNADPTVALGAATKQYVDNSIGGKLAIASNLSDLNNASTARTNLGLKTGAVTNITVSASAPSGGSDGDIWIQ